MTYSNTYSSPSSPTNFNPFSGMGMRKGGRPSLFPGSGDGSTLNLDFTTGVLDSRLTFSRNGTATFVNSSGYVEYAGANTAPHSESLSVGLGYSDNAILSRSTTTSPTGNTAVVFYPTIVLDYHRLQFSSPIAMAGATTISVYVKQIGSDYRAGINAFTYIGASVICSLVGAGSVVGAVGGTAPNRAATITKVTDDGWYRITLTGTYNTISSVYVFMASSTSTDSTGLNFLGVDQQGIAIWGLQVNPGSTVQTYYPTTTAAYHAPRFDYSPTTIGEPRGLLVEGSSINYMLQSTTLNPHTTFNMRAIATGSITDPEGTTDKARIIAADGSTNIHGRYLQVTAGTNTTITVSIFAKKNGYKYLYLADIANSRSAVRFDLDDGSTSNSSGPGFVSASATSYPNGWWRCSMVVNVVASTSYAWSYVGVPTTGATFSAVGATYTGTNTDSDGIYCYGFSVEAGSGASSYIPTGASQVTRTTDYCTIPTASFIPGNPYPQTLFVDCIPNTPSGAFVDLVRVFDRTGGTFAYGTQIYYYNAPTMIPMRKIYASTNTERNLANGLAYGTRHKFALSIDAASYSGSYDGVTALGVATAPTALATVVTHMGIGCSGDSSAQSVMFGTIRQIKFYPTALSQSAINTLTTL